ncbi:MAG: phosphopantothenoylcysteine decarboxylase [Candidatus Omnitrophica bacterium]|nr:phosphopantothenoylcysteine decarboxylase [Candidatus Omnitrophota bacterium]
MKRLRVLVTCGATWSPIDEVRVISNISSGQMGHLIASFFKSQGAHVTVIEGPVTHQLIDKGIRVIKYRYFDELAKALRLELVKRYDVVVHAAAVSDFRLLKSSKTKISSVKGLTLRLVPNPKLIKDIKRQSPRCFLIGFKLEPNLNLVNVFGYVKPLFEEAGCDLVVANTLKDGYQGFIIDKEGNMLSRASNKRALALRLVKLTCNAQK